MPEAVSEAVSDAVSDVTEIRSPLDSILPPPVQVIPKSSPTDLNRGTELD